MGYILVTGSTRGIGFEIAKQLSDNGFSVIITGRTLETLESAKRELGERIIHKFMRVNFEDDEDLTLFLENIKTLEIDAIVHNLGGKIPNDKHPINIDVLNRSIHLNFTISVKINNTLIDNVTKNPNKIIYIGSTASLHAKASPCYVLSKSLIDTYVKNISLLYAEKNILICGVQPGISAHAGSEWDQKKEIEPEKYIDTKVSQPLRRFLMPSEIAECVVSIINLKSLALTGSMIKLDANCY